jgi:hypothetical protein
MGENLRGDMGCQSRSEKYEMTVVDLSLTLLDQ